MMKKIIKISVAFALLSAPVIAQTKEQVQQIVSSYDSNESAEVVRLISEAENQRIRAAKERASALNMPYEFIAENGERAVLSGLDIEGNPVYIQTYNVTGAQTIGAHQLYNGGTLGIDINGQGMTAGIWDGGSVLQTHQAVTGRVVLGEQFIPTSGHGTHVGGTIISDGTGNASTRGIAFGASLRSYDFDLDDSEMAAEAATGLMLSNHSYGLPAERLPTAALGKYNNDARSFDQMTNFFEFYLPVISAGNARNAGANFIDNGYDILTDTKIAKNPMVVGAVFQVTNYLGPQSVGMSSFSSWGPTDDGRIKPDLVAKGVNVLSLGSSSNTAVANMQGTSMSAPMVTGGLVLLQQLHNQQKGNFLKAYTLKLLALLNTKEAGANPGPDYAFGWGLLDVEASAQHILNLDDTSTIQELTLANGNTFTRTVTSNGGVLKVGIGWNDVQGNIPSGNIEDDSTPILINDLDLKLTDANGTDYFPWKLDVANFTAAATKGVNNVDNIEIVEIQAPAGTYTITVSHKGTLVGGGSTENYALLINGADTGTLSNKENQLNDFVIYPNPAQNDVTVTFNNQLSGSKVNVEIYDVLGQRVSNNSFQNSGRFEQRIDISSLKSGIYLVRVGDGNVSSTKKLVIN